MKNWLQHSRNERLIILQQASARSGLSAKILEKDWWVTLVLKALFQTPYASHLLFKGGTSLSKCWKIIERLSEDIDIAIDRRFLGFGDDPSKQQVKNLKRKACTFTSNDLKDALARQLHALGVPEGMITITAGPIAEKRPYPDPQTLHVVYPSLLEAVSYIKDDVKIEVSARSLREPWAMQPVQSLIDEYLPGPYSEAPFDVPAVSPMRTFLEKIFLLHEEFLKPADKKIRDIRMSRHLYDLERLMDTEHAHLALADSDFYNSIIKHRIKFMQLPWVQYDTLHPLTVSFLPPAPVLAAYRIDYENMKQQMIYGTAPDFDTLISRLSTLLQRIRKIA